jgi:hypothetical protein
MLKKLDAKETEWVSNKVNKTGGLFTTPIFQKRGA